MRSTRATQSDHRRSHAAVAVIPARGGSKRIPRKNVRPFSGRPMLAWPVAAALASGLFERVIVSTDDADVAQVAREAGAEVPFIRPRELSDDHTGTLDVIAHAVGWLDVQGQTPGHVCCIYPTAPLLMPADLMAARAELLRGSWDYVFSAATFEFPVMRALALDETGAMTMLFPEHERTRSQDLPTIVHDAGQFYWGTAEAWLTGQPIYGPRSRAYLIPRWRVQDIDTPEDWTRAERLHRVHEESMKHDH